MRGNTTARASCPSILNDEGNTTGGQGLMPIHPQRRPHAHPSSTMRGTLRASCPSILNDEGNATAQGLCPSILNDEGNTTVQGLMPIHPQR
ncbi:unnamed protein product [Boreogadus saida]